MLRIAFEFGDNPMQSFLFLLLSIGVIYMLLIGILRPFDEKKEEESDEFAEANPMEDPYAEESDETEQDDTEESAYTPLEEQKPERSDLAEILGVLTPRKGHFATPIILDLNILVFICMVFVGAGFSPSRLPDCSAGVPTAVRSSWKGSTGDYLPPPSCMEDSSI